MCVCIIVTLRRGIWFVFLRQMENNLKHFFYSDILPLFCRKLFSGKWPKFAPGHYYPITACLWCRYSIFVCVNSKTPEEEKKHEQGHVSLSFIDVRVCNKILWEKRVILQVIHTHKARESEISNSKGSGCIKVS